MKEIRHVRFGLSELIRAVQVYQHSRIPPLVPDALSFYWNWATARGWNLVAVTNQMNPHETIISAERHPQLEMRNEEFWNVIWSAEEADGPCDLVEEVNGSQLPSLERAVVAELKERGWHLEGPTLHQSGYEMIRYEELVSVCAGDEDDPLTIANELEREAQI